METEKLLEAAARAYDAADRHKAGLMAVIAVVEKAMREDGYVKLPSEWYIAEDGDGDPAIWLEHEGGNSNWDLVVGTRFAAGNAKIEKPIADWLWGNIRKVES